MGKYYAAAVALMVVAAMLIAAVLGAPLQWVVFTGGIVEAAVIFFTFFAPSWGELVAMLAPATRTTGYRMVTMGPRFSFEADSTSVSATVPVTIIDYRDPRGQWRYFRDTAAAVRWLEEAGAKFTSVDISGLDVLAFYVFGCDERFLGHSDLAEKHLTGVDSRA